MKNLHFYIQSAMLILTISIAVQLPFNWYLIIWVVLIEFVLLIYQLFMSMFLVSKLSRKTLLLNIHFYGFWCYALLLIILRLFDPNWMTTEMWQIAFIVIPWALIIFFLVTLDELESARNYRV